MTGSAAANVFAEAIEASGAETALYRSRVNAARRPGGRWLNDGRTRSDNLGDLQGELAERGYEPYQDEACLRLRNCPFNSVAREFPVVACGMNLALVEGLLAELGLAVNTRRGWTGGLASVLRHDLGSARWVTGLHGREASSWR